MFWQSDADFSQFFPSTGTAPCYGLYSPSIDRFFHVSSSDLFVLMTATRFLSSKLLLLTIAWSPEQQNNASISNTNCLEWTMAYRILQASHSRPRLLTLKGPQLVHVGTPKYTEMEHHLEFQSRIQFVVRATTALMISDAMFCGGDYRNYVSHFPAFTDLNGQVDTGPGYDGHHSYTEIERILYTFSSIEQAIEDIKAVTMLPYTRDKFDSIFYAT